MDKRLENEHKRKVMRERTRIRLSEPDIRTKGQIEAAREAAGRAARMAELTAEKMRRL